MFVRRALWTLGIVLASVAHASAQCPTPWPYAAAGDWYGYTNLWQHTYTGRTPPYFAVHPPVYYSGAIVRIPYGHSPWATWSAASPAAPRAAAAMEFAPAVAPAVASEAPVMLKNPHFGKPTASRLQPSAQPLRLNVSAPIEQVRGEWITNPFVSGTDRVAARNVR
jgi:hypothetical protein